MDKQHNAKVFLKTLGLMFLIGSLMVSAVMAETIVEVTYPNGGEILAGIVNVTWDGTYVSGTVPDRWAVAYETVGSGWQYITTGSGDSANNIVITDRNTTWKTDVLAGATNYHLKVIALAGITSVGEDVSDGTFTIDNTKPTSVVNLLSEYQNTATFTITYNSSDPLSGVDYVELYYNKDGGGWTQYNGQFTTGSIEFDASQTGGDGTYQFYTQARDEARNAENAPGSADTSTIVDTTNPVGSLTGVPAWQKASVDLTLTCSDVGGSGCNNTEDYLTIVDYGLGCTPTDAYTGPVTVNSYSTACWLVTDLAGNTGSNSSTIMVDQATPTPTVTNAPSGRIINPVGVTPTMSCSDLQSGCNATTDKFRYYGNDPVNCDENYANYSDFGSISAVTDHNWVCVASIDNAGNIGYSTPAEFHVFATIQGAIDDALAGDIIEVPAGTFNERLDVDKGVILQSSDGPASTIIEADAGGVFINIQGAASDFVLDGFTLVPNTTTTRVIQLENSPSDVQIKNNIINTNGGATMGISVGAAGSSGLIVEGNTFSNGENGDGYMFAEDSSDIRVIDNIFTFSAQQSSGYAIEIAKAGGTSIISGNNVTNASTCIFILDGTGDTTDLNISNNVLNNCINGIRFYSGYAVGGVIAPSAADVWIEYNTINGATNGLRIPSGADINSANFKIINNKFSENTNAVVHDDAEALTAEYNWWGHLSGPGGAGPGIGNDISGTGGAVDFTPWHVTEEGDLDTTAPTSEVTTLAAYSNSLTFNIPYDAADDYGLIGIKLYENNSDVNTTDIPGYPTSTSGTISRTVAADGTYEYYTRAIDIKGNPDGLEGAPGVADATIIVDTANPVTTDSGTDAAWHDSDVTVTLSCDDGAGNSGCDTTYYCVDQAGTCVPGTVGTSVVVSTEGTNYVRFYSTDNAGNAETTQSADNTVKIDTSDSSITAVTNVTAKKIGQNIQINANVTDLGGGVNSSGVFLHYNNGSDVTVIMGNSTGDIYNTTISAPANAMTLTYYVTALDNVGNEARDPVTGTYTTTIKDIVLSLSQGWNLVSVPKTLLSNSKTDTFSSDDVWEYNATSKAWVQPQTIDPGEGYWVDHAVVEDKPLDYQSPCHGPNCGPSETVYLQPAWNLIGHMCTEEQDIELAFPSGIYNNLFVLRYDKSADSFQTHSTQVGGVTEFSEMTPGEGYWVFVVGSNELPYTNVCG